MPYTNLSPEQVAQIKARLHKELDNLGNHVFFSSVDYDVFSMMRLQNAAADLNSIGTSAVLESLNDAVMNVINFTNDESEKFRFSNEYIHSSIYYLTQVSNFIALSAECV